MCAVLSVTMATRRLAELIVLFPVKKAGCGDGQKKVWAEERYSSLLAVVFSVLVSSLLLPLSSVDEPESLRALRLEVELDLRLSVT